MKVLKIFLLATILSLFFAAPFGGSVFAVDPFEDVCKQGGTHEAAACDTDGSNPISGTDGVITAVTNIIALIAGTAAVIIIIIAGFQFIMANGDSSKVTNARNAIIYAVIGLVVIIVARGVILWVLGRI